MLKKTVVFILICALSFGFSGCDVNSINSFISEITNSEPVDLTTDSAVNYSEFDKFSLPNDTCYRAVQTDNGYSQLESDGLQKFYDKIEKNIYTVSDKPDKDGRYLIKQICLLNIELSERDIRKVIFAYESDNPQIFWLDNTFGYGKSEGSTVIQLYSYISAEECNSELRKLEKNVDKILNGLKPGLTEFERELYIHDSIVNLSVYSTGVKSLSDGWRHFASVGLINDGTAVCEGYAKGTQLLLSYAGIECTLINGKSKNELHMWDLVKIDGEWYHLDVTWDDVEDGTTYKYFNLNDKYINIDHSISKNYSELSDDEICGTKTGKKELFNLDIPKCTSEKNNFFVKKAILINSLEDSENYFHITGFIVDAVISGKNSVYIRVGESIDYDSAVNTLFNSYNGVFFESLTMADNDIRFDYKNVKRINTKSALISKDSQFRIIEVVITFVNT